MLLDVARPSTNLAVNGRGAFLIVGNLMRAVVIVRSVAIAADVALFHGFGSLHSLLRLHGHGHRVRGC